jgi:hypothetical protein
MGLKDWLAGNVAGPQSYGEVMGRQAREGGSALANAVFLSYGKRPEKAHPIIFDTLYDMESTGLKSRYAPHAKLEVNALTVEEQQLLRNLSTSMISYAFLVNSNGALQNMRRDNTSKFRNGLGASLQNSMVSCGLFDNFEAAGDALLSYIRSMGSVSAILNTEKPASEDLLEHFIIRGVAASGATGQYGFVRSGVTGFDTIAVSLVEKTLVAIVGATKQYQW